MAKIAVLGGGGAVGSVVSVALARSGKVFQVVIADADCERAAEVETRR